MMQAGPLNADRQGGGGGPVLLGAKPQSRLASRAAKAMGAGRPMTSNMSANYVGHQAAGLGGKSVFDSLPKEDSHESDERKAERMENQIFALLRDAMDCLNRKDFTLAHARVVEAQKKEKELRDHRRAAQMADQISKELTVCIWCHKAKVHAASGQYTQALETYSRLLKSTSGAALAEIRYLMGEVLCAQKKYEEAVRCFTMALDNVPPNYPRLRQKIGHMKARAALRCENWAEAIADVEESLWVPAAQAGDPHGAPGSRGQPQAAEPSRTNPYAPCTRFAPLYTLLICRYALGQREEGLETYKRLVGSSVLVGDHSETLDLDDAIDSFTADERRARVDDADQGDAYASPGATAPSGAEAVDEDLDGLARFNAAMRHDHRTKILAAARLLAPVVCWKETDGYDKLSAILRERGHHSLSLQVQMSKALALLRKNEFESATKTMLGVDREGIEIAVAMGISVPPNVLRRAEGTSLAAIISSGDGHSGSASELLGIDGLVDKTAPGARPGDGAERAAAVGLEGDMARDGGKQPYATFVPRGVHTNLSFIYYLRGDYESALGHATIALDVDPYDAFAHVNLGCVYAHLGQWEKALKEFEEASAVNADCLQASYNAGLAQYRQQDFTAALGCFQRVIARYPSNVDALFMAADCEAKLADVEGAISHLNAISTILGHLHATDASVLAKLGDLYMLSGDETQAAHYMQEAHKLVPFDLDIIGWLGAHYVRGELYEQARLLFDKAARVTVHNPKWWLMSAACLKRTNQTREAIAEYKKILEKFPAEVEALKSLMALYAQLGQKEESDEIALRLQKLSANLAAASAGELELERMKSQALTGPSVKKDGEDREIVADQKRADGDDDPFGTDDVAGNLLAGEGDDP